MFVVSNIHIWRQQKVCVVRDTCISFKDKGNRKYLLYMSFTSVTRRQWRVFVTREFHSCYKKNGNGRCLS